MLGKGDLNRCTQFTLDEFFTKYHKNYSFGYPFSKGEKESQRIMRKFAELVHEELLKNPDGFKLPANTGTLIISGAEMNARDKRSTKDNYKEYRNVKTNRVVYTTHYIYGEERGRTILSVLWKFKNPTPLRRKIKERIDKDNFRHWYVFDKVNDVKRLGIPPDIPRK